MVVLVTCKNKEEQIKNEGVRVVTRDSPFNPIRASVAMETRVLIRSYQNLSQLISHPNDALNEI